MDDVVNVKSDNIDSNNQVPCKLYQDICNLKSCYLKLYNHVLGDTAPIKDCEIKLTHKQLNKLTKHDLLPHITDLANCISPICRPDFVAAPDNCVFSSEHHNIDNLITRTVTNVMENNKFEDLRGQLNSLQCKIDALSLTRVSLSSSEGNTPVVNDNTECVTPIVNTTKHIELRKPDFVDGDHLTDITNFLDKQNSTTLKGRSVLSLGARYRYNGSPKDVSIPIPDTIKEVINKIEDIYPGSEINSCLVNKYVGKDSYLPEHSDNENVLKPESNIYTLSIGSSRDVVFRDSSTGAERTVIADNGSLYVMSQPSQCLWTHRIDKCDVPADTVDEGDNENVRYSLTFRCIHKDYTNSTVILGDSNTKHLKFGSGKGTFGLSLPGRRKETFHIHDIDPSACLGYQNIVLHMGINDLRDRSPGRTADDPEPWNIHGHFNNLKDKIVKIQALCPKAKITISPVLPTKIPLLNERAMKFNKLMQNYIVNSDTNVQFMNFSGFVNNEGLLDEGLGVFNNERDKFHLGKQGIRALANIIKNSILKRHVDGRSYSSVLSRRGNAEFPRLSALS